MLAALGVVCRDSSCVQKLPYLSHHADIITRFVIRSDDNNEIPPILYLKMTSPLSKINGPIYSTWRWFQHAILHYNTTFIGHSEDDVHHYMPTLISMLYLAKLKLGDRPIAIGAMEIFHYCTCTHKAHFFWSHYNQNKAYDCKKKNASGVYEGGRIFHSNTTEGSVIGPFPMLKGPLYFLSTFVVNRIINNAWVQKEWNAQLLRTTGWAWDDVFVGMAMAMSNITDLTFVNAMNLYGESCRPYRKPVHHKPCPYNVHLIKSKVKDLHCSSIYSNSCANSRWSSCRLQL